MDAITRSQLALLLENEAHNVVAEHIRAGADPARELGQHDGKGLRKALRQSRYGDAQSRNAQATFEAIVRGEITVLEDAR